LRHKFQHGATAIRLLVQRRDTKRRSWFILTILNHNKKPSENVSKYVNLQIEAEGAWGTENLA